MTNLHLQQSAIEYGCDISQASQVVVLIHGREQEPAIMQEMIVRPLSLDKVFYLAPAAAGRSWYPAGFMADIAENEPWLGQAMECIHFHVEALVSRGWAANKIVLIGFSQGACIACEYICRYPRRYAGIAALTGGLIGPADTSWPGGSLQGTPVLLASSDIDPWVPIGRVEETRSVLLERGAVVDYRVYDGMEHIVNEDELSALKQMITAWGPGS